MRIFVLIYSLSAGGAERATANLTKRWVAAGHDVTVATFSREPDFYELDQRVKRLQLGGAAVNMSLIGSIVNTLARVMRVRRAIRASKGAVAIGVMTTSSVLIGLASVGLRVRTVGWEHIHPPMVPLGPTRELVRRLAYGLLDTVVALTSKSAQWLRENTRARSIEVVPNSLTLPLPRTKDILLPSAVVPESKRILLAVGRLEHQKGFDQLLDAFSLCAAGAQGWSLVILGEGSLRERLEGKVRELGLQEKVYMPGAVGNVADWYAAASLLVMSSRFEGFPFVLLEAMAHGVPVVSFDCDTGPRDIIRHGVDGLLVPVGDIEALSKTISVLVANERLRLEYAARAREVVRRFSEDGVIAMWDRVLSNNRVDDH